MMNETISPVQQLSQAFAATVETVGKSVLRVEARRRGHASGVIWSDDGLVVTAHHAVQRDKNIRLGLADGAVVEAELVGRDPSTDIAVLKGKSGDYLVPEWASTDDLKVGHLVLSVGRHDAFPQASLGIVSKIGPAWRTGAGGKVDRYVQTDIAIYPGYSGSALVNAQGQVVGLNSSWLKRRLPLSLPFPTVSHVVDQLLKHGSVQRGYLGIGAYPVKLHASLADELDQKSGLLIISIESDSPADNAGLLIGDQLIGYNDIKLRKVDDLLVQLASQEAGAAATVQLIRAGKPMEVELTLGARG